MATNDNYMAVGLRRVFVAKRNTTSGVMEIPAGTPAGTAYYGVRAQGALGLTPTPAAPNRVPVNGDDLLQHTFSLPPRESFTGELRVSKTDFEVIALLTGVKVFGSGDIRKVAVGTDKQGSEDDVVIWGYREAAVGDDELTTYGNRRWELVYFPNCRVNLRGNPWQDATAAEITYDIIANLSRVDEAGVTLTEAVHGCTRAPCIMVHTTNKPWIDVFEGDGSETDFTLSQAAYVDSDSIQVWIDGVSTAFSETNGVVTPTGGVADGETLVIEYEWDDSV